MVVKTFIGKTQREVMSKARQEMGDDILLVESREIESPDGKGRFVQIVVADKGEKADEIPVNGATDSYQSVRKKLKQRLDQYQADRINQTPTRASMFPDTNEMVASQLTGWRVNVYTQLNTLGILSASSLKYILDLQPGFFSRFPSLPPTQTIVEEIIRQQLTTLCQASRPTADLSRIIALVGPTGVGKTTTIMKMVSSPTVFAGERVGIITTDVYRMGGTAALKAFGEISQVKIFYAGNTEEMQFAIQQMENMDRIIIDTPGRSPFFPGYIKELIETFSGLESLSVLLTLSLTTSLDDLFLEIGLFLPVGIRGLVITKFDETTQGGKLLSLLEEVHLPLHFICNGQGIPHDIERAEGDIVFNNIFRKVDTHGSVNQ